jgi:hypothetical protein
MSSSKNAVAAAAASRSSLLTSGLFAPAAALLAQLVMPHGPTATEGSARKVDLRGRAKPTTVSDGKVCMVAWPPRPSPSGGTTARRGTGGP